ncbi:MAG: hypothetical protein ABW223_13720 [Rariglobus sp.]
MSSHDTNHGKILFHGAEAGQITNTMIERRAHENALIDGRASASAEDRRAARQELQGDALPDTVSNDSASIALSMNRDPSDPVSVPGHQIPDHNDGDDQDMIERLAIEGVEEAQHDQMLAARRQKNS